MEQIRENGKNALRLYLQNENNISAFDQLAYNLSEEDEQNYKNIIMEINMYIHQEKKLKEIVDIFQNDKHNFNNSTFDEIRSLQEEQDNFIIKPFEIEEGVLQCNKCGSKKTFSYSKQTRGGDEGTTVFAVCSECKAKWKM